MQITNAIAVPYHQYLGICLFANVANGSVFSIWCNYYDVMMYREWKREETKNTDKIVQKFIDGIEADQKKSRGMYNFPAVLDLRYFTTK
ncbi:hypothetical protein T4D_3497 [Trichinella pseudospiralis]|uniref:Uncharacterized protein n=1 Tax=Trichinella pseudospiralis TaxID=6337 RepID=A0A0V1FDP8_TRIPS|nr:hypothetical protein T4D_3497 [Trichinella pseudospiralis]